MQPSSAADASVAPAPELDAGLDASVTLEAAAPVINCATADAGIACDDSVFCNGTELCAPNDPGADTRGCVAGALLVCSAGTTCSEQQRMCSPCSDTLLDDADGDGHEAKSCGGDDCRDDDRSIFTGGVESCDGKDNDCDGQVDGAPADLACASVAPLASSSSCVTGSCAVVCSDPDFDFLGGACVKHDDCAGVTACGPGACVDGVRAHTCLCPPGYTGRGTPACIDIDECANAATHSCDTAPLACSNDDGSFHCQCPSSHFGNGTGPHGCLRKTLAVAAGVKQTCALLSGGKLKCWGSDEFGKLGLAAPIPTPRGSTPDSMGDALPFVELGAGRSAVSLAVGSDLTCAVLDDGSAKCWGYNGYGATGAADPSAHGIATALAPLPSGQKAQAVGAGSGYGYALLADGTLGSWGHGFASYAFAGERYRAFDRSPRYDSYHLCALLETGAVRCWPGNGTYADPLNYGPLGWSYTAGLPVESYPLTQLGTASSAKSIATGESHSCALLEDGRVKCWGRNDRGQLGLGDTLSRGNDPASMGDALPALPFAAKVRALAAGGNHTCALFDAGVVKCWGENEHGQLGAGSSEDLGDQPGELEALLPVDLGVGRSAVAIDVGSHSCAVLDDGSLKCWGSNAAGELGQGDNLDRGTTPASLGAALRAVDVGG